MFAATIAQVVLKLLQTIVAIQKLVILFYDHICSSSYHALCTRYENGL